MRSVRTRSEPSLLRLPSLLFIYALLGILGSLLASALFNDAFYEGLAFQSPLSLIFFSVPLVLAILLLVSSVGLIRDIVGQRPGSKLQARFFGYFVVVAMLSSVPATVMITKFMDDILSPEFGLDSTEATLDARHFALDAYHYRLKFLETVVSDPAFTSLLSLAATNQASSLPSNLDSAFLALQRFNRNGADQWLETAFLGETDFKIKQPPAWTSGFLAREANRDRDCFRYVLALEPDQIWIITFSLGENFDSRVDRLEAVAARAESFSAFKRAFKRLVIFLYIAFSLPTLMMTVIIAFSFSASLTQPIVALAEATKRVAEGDFNIRILTQPRDELGALVESFNAMVSDLEASREALIRNEKITIWKDMAQRLAHELKNPLTPIRLSAERLLRRYRSEPERLGEIVESSMMAIIQEVESLSTMLSDFRAFAQLPLPALTWTSIGELIDEVVQSYRNSYPGIEFRIDSVRGDLVAQVDRRQMTQIITNLILNAADAMNGNGQLDFATDLVKKRNCGYCRLSVRDTGCGIPDKDRALIFTPYYTSKLTGTGLGLSIVERIVVDHGGSIWFDSAVGVGTTFFIDLPIDRSPEREAALEESNGP